MRQEHFAPRFGRQIFNFFKWLGLSLFFPLGAGDRMAREAADQAGGAATVNKRDLAVLLQVTAPTLDRWIECWKGFPVVERGARGRGWRFDPIAVLAFVEERRGADRRAEEEREADLDALDLPLDDDDGRKAGTLSPADQLAMARVARLRREEAEQAGKLVSREEIEAALAEGLPELLRAVRDAVRAWCGAQGVPAEETRSFDAAIARGWTTTVRELQARMRAGEDDEAYLTT